jgi:hypothetical protein
MLSSESVYPYDRRSPSCRFTWRAYYQEKIPTDIQKGLFRQILTDKMLLKRGKQQKYGYCLDSVFCKSEKNVTSGNPTCRNGLRSENGAFCGDMIVTGNPGIEPRGYSGSARSRFKTPCSATPSIPQPAQSSAVSQPGRTPRRSASRPASQHSG